MFVTITTSLQDIFVTLSELDNEKYFMCHIDDFKFLADMIEHVPLQLRVRYVFCCAPIMRKQPFICTMFLKVCPGAGVGVGVGEGEGGDTVDHSPRHIIKDPKSVDNTFKHVF